jgi:hypothetical protein
LQIAGNFSANRLPIQLCLAGQTLCPNGGWSQLSAGGGCVQDNIGRSFPRAPDDQLHRPQVRGFSAVFNNESGGTFNANTPTSLAIEYLYSGAERRDLQQRGYRRWTIFTLEETGYEVSQARSPPPWPA